MRFLLEDLPAALKGNPPNVGGIFTTLYGGGIVAVNRIVKKKVLAPAVKLIEVENHLIAKKAQPGQFVILRVHEKGERIPLTISDYDREKGTVTIIFQEVGKTTTLLGRLEEGDRILDLVGPLGKPTHLEGLQRVVVVGGGLGTALVFSQVKELHRRGTKVDCIIGARNKDLIILEEEIKPYCANLYIATDDGSKGHKGFVTDVLKRLLDEGNRYDRAIAVGPLIMMKVVSNLTRQYGLPTVVSMNPIMVDGTGMCGCCRLTVGGQTKFACVDGPEFDGHLVDFDEVIKRTAMYREEEKTAMELLQRSLKEGV
ncbi:ferredoxin--NADP+ reductase [Thermodesulfitimonas autotrophica]|uniref:Ferredoxin--NADP+ reductase n=1 Tax=Thermodesulfitimonas autotrophica TaxID=1894989 RepID=A0A3N5AP00_9THEO|nr:ferredoxin--NADP+ reductase [Thermodesulfitimonas autotrophica]